MSRFVMGLIVLFSFFNASAQSSFNMCSSTSTTATTGFFYDSGGPSFSHGNNENCSFLISPPGCVTGLTMTFTQMSLESCCDRLRIYDGTSAAGTLIGTYTGSTLPPVINSTTGSIFLNFTSDGSVTFSGWAASWTSTVSTSPPNADFNIANNNPPLLSAVDFTDATTGFPISWIWDFGDSNSSTDQNPTHTYSSPGTYRVSLSATNCFSTDTISKLITVQSSPTVNTNPTNLNYTVSCGDTISGSYYVKNEGRGDLLFTASLSTPNAPSTGPLKVLSYLTGVDIFTEYPNTLASLNRLYTNYTLTEVNSTIGSEIRDSLVGKDVFLIPEIESGGTAHFPILAAEIENFARNGGTVIFLGSRNGFNSYLFEPGIFTGSNAGNTSGGSLALNLPNHPMADSVVPPFNATSLTTYLDITNPGIESVFTFNSGDEVIAYLDYGSGRYIYNGYDYFGTSPFQDRLMANAFYIAERSRLGGNATYSDTLSPGDSVLVNFEIPLGNTTSGTYTDTIFITSNDSANPTFFLPITYTVNGDPNLQLSQTTFNFGVQQVGSTTPDTLILNNPGCSPLVIDSLITNGGEFVLNLNNAIIPAFGSDTLFITFQPGLIQANTDTLRIYNNDSLRFVFLNGTGVGAPSITFAPTLINDTIFSCDDSLSIPIQFNNSGLGPLNTTLSLVDNSSNSSSGLVFSDGFESGINFSDWTIVNGSNTFTLVTTNPASGNNCLGIRGSATRALMHQFTPAPVDAFAFKVRTDATFSGNTNYVAVGNAIDEFGVASVRYTGNGFWEVTSGSPAVVYAAVNTWTSFEFRNVDYVTHTFDLWIDGTLQASQLFFDNIFISDASRVNLICFSSAFTSYYDDIRIGGNAVPNWAFLSSDSINVPIADSTTINLNLYSQGLNNGTYQSEIYLQSNDPLSPFDTIPVNLTVLGQPEIALSASCFSHLPTQQFSSSLDSVRIINPGCDSLVISNIVSSSSEFSPRFTSLTIPAKDSAWIYVDFNPTSVGIVSGQLNVFNNAIDTNICLFATSIGSPIVNHFPNSINATIRNCDDSVTIPISIFNTGTGPLNWNLTGGFGIDDDFESGIDPTIWTVIGGFPSNSCGTASGANALYFNGGFTRSATTVALNTNRGGNVDFELKIATGGGACEDADPGEEVVLEYSNDGVIWFIMNTYFTNLYPNFTSISEPIPAAARTSATQFRFRQLRFSGSSFDHWAIDDVKINSGNVGGFITSISPDSGIVNVGDSVTVFVTISSRDLISGFYSDSIIIASNDPLTPFDTIPVNLDYIGRPEIAFSQTAFNFGNVFVGSSNIDSLEIYNTGCDTLNILNAIPLNAAYTVLSYPNLLLPDDTARLVVEFRPLTVGTFNSLVRIFNDDRDTSISVSGTSTPAPQISVTPSSFNVTLKPCDTVNLPMLIRNIGGSNLTFSMDSSLTVGSRPEVLALTYGVDYFGEYQNTIAAINQYYTNYNLTEINTTIASSLATALVNKDVLLIAETETGLPSVYATFATVLQNFVTSGGTVIFCGADPTDAQCMFNTGLFSGSGLGSFGGGMVNVGPSHPIMNGVSASPVSQNATFRYNITNTNKVDLLTYLGNTVTCYRNLGAGKVILVGYDYFSNTNADASRQIANAVEWGATGSLPSWLRLTSSNGTVTPADTSVIGVTFDGNGLTPGTYTGTITINNNDPLNPVVTIPCTLNISFAPCAEIAYTIPNQCSGLVVFGDSSINSPTIWRWNFGDGNSSTQQNPSHTYASAGLYNVRLITTNAFGSDTTFQQVPVNIMDADFTVAPPLVTNTPIQFTSTALGAISWFWDFGDGGSSSIANPTHTYLTSGQFVVSLVAVNGASCTDIKRDTLNILLVGLEDQVTAEQFVVYPNPNKGRFLIQNQSAVKLERILVYNAKGKLIEDEVINVEPSNERIIQLKEVASGIYMINLEFENGRSIQKKFMID